MSEFPKLPFEQFIKKAHQLNSPKTILVYGDPKRGKSWFAASSAEVAELSPVLILDTEGGSSAIARDWKDVDVIDIKSHEEMENAVNALITQKHKYKTVVIDTLGVAMDRAEKFFGDKAENRNNKFGKWGDLKEWVTSMTRKLHSSPFLAILVAHAQDEKDDQTGAVKTVPMLPGSAKNTLPAIPDIIAYMTAEANEQGEIHRVMYMESSDRLVSGNRFGLPGRLVDPSMKKIIDKINGGNK
jgi:phage nucleotide-binding protein